MLVFAWPLRPLSCQRWACTGSHGFLASSRSLQTSWAPTILNMLLWRPPTKARELYKQGEGTWLPWTVSFLASLGRVLSKEVWDWVIMNPVLDRCSLVFPCSPHDFWWLATHDRPWDVMQNRLSNVFIWTFEVSDKSNITSVGTPNIIRNFKFNLQNFFFSFVQNHLHGYYLQVLKPKVVWESNWVPKGLAAKVLNYQRFVYTEKLTSMWFNLVKDSTLLQFICFRLHFRSRSFPSGTSNGGISTFSSSRVEAVKSARFQNLSSSSFVNLGCFPEHHCGKRLGFGRAKAKRWGAISEAPFFNWQVRATVSVTTDSVTRPS